MCECKVCKDDKRWRDVIKNGTVDDRFEVYNEMQSRIELAETDASIYRAILDGTWPNALEILERSLEIIKAKNAQNLPITN